jgi:hypothetical protein
LQALLCGYYTRNRGTTASAALQPRAAKRARALVREQLKHGPKPGAQVKVAASCVTFRNGTAWSFLFLGKSGSKSGCCHQNQIQSKKMQLAPYGNSTLCTHATPIHYARTLRRFITYEEPIMGMIANLLKKILQIPADALVASSKKLPNIIASVKKDARFYGIFYPYKADQESFILLKSHDQSLNLDNFIGLPIPPQELWEDYGIAAEYFLSSGKTDIDQMKEILCLSDFRIQDGNRILDLGCAAGRMIRWLYENADRCEIWGMDISARHIVWCQDHLSPPFNFATITTAPHLPFEDGYFNLVYCGSVFTHISDLADAWLLELKRILSVCPGRY